MKNLLYSSSRLIDSTTHFNNLLPLELIHQCSGTFNFRPIKDCKNFFFASLFLYFTEAACRVKSSNCCFLAKHRVLLVFLQPLSNFYIVIICNRWYRWSADWCSSLINNYGFDNLYWDGQEGTSFTTNGLKRGHEGTNILRASSHSCVPLLIIMHFTLILLYYKAILQTNSLIEYI